MRLPAEDEQTAGSSAYPADPAERAPYRPSRLGTILTLLVLVVVGAELGAVGALLSPAAPRMFGVSVPLGVPVGPLANLAVGVWVVRALGHKLAVAAPALGWLLIVVPFGANRPEGDLVITNGGTGIAFLLAGSVAWVLAAVLGRPDAPNGLSTG